jgi:hypothetical protein
MIVPIEVPFFDIRDAIRILGFHKSEVSNGAYEVNNDYMHNSLSSWLQDLTSKTY